MRLFFGMSPDGGCIIEFVLAPMPSFASQLQSALNIPQQMFTTIVEGLTAGAISFLDQPLPSVANFFAGSFEDSESDSGNNNNQIGAIVTTPGVM